MTSPESVDTERKAFENWFCTAATARYSDWFKRLGDGTYSYDHTRTAWEAWLARAAHAQCAAIDEPEPVAWRWQVYGIWHYAGGWPVSGAEPLYLRPTGAKQ